MPGDIKAKYASSFTVVDSGLNSLAASSSRLGGYESNAVNSVSYSGGPMLDFILAGRFTAASANHNAGQIDVWVVGAENDTPEWPDVFDGTASTETVSSANVLAGLGRLAGSVLGDSVNGRVYNIPPVSIASLFGGVIPPQWVVFVAHNIHTGTNAWAASGHKVSATPVLAQYT